MNRSLSLLAALALLAPASLSGQNTQWNQATLEDLGGVFIRLEVGEPCQAAGVSGSDFEAAVSLQLIEAEVGVLTREEMLRNPALPELRVDLDCAPGNGATAYSVGLRVQQAAQMVRDTQVTLPEAVTWYTTKLGVAAGSELETALQSALTEQLTEFAKAWGEANADEGRDRG